MGANLQRHRSHSSSEASQSQDFPAATVPMPATVPVPDTVPVASPESEPAMPDVKNGDSIQSVCSSTALDDFLANSDLKVCRKSVYGLVELYYPTKGHLWIEYGPKMFLLTMATDFTNIKSRCVARRQSSKPRESPRMQKSDKVRLQAKQKSPSSFKLKKNQATIFFFEVHSPTIPQQLLKVSSSLS